MNLSTHDLQGELRTICEIVEESYQELASVLANKEASVAKARDSLNWFQQQVLYVSQSIDPGEYDGMPITQDQFDFVRIQLNKVLGTRSRTKLSLPRRSVAVPESIEPFRSSATQLALGMSSELTAKCNPSFSERDLLILGLDLQEFVSSLSKDMHNILLAITSSKLVSAIEVTCAATLFTHDGSEDFRVLLASIDSRLAFLWLLARSEVLTLLT
ncbi:MAG: hypothetical protein IT205_10470 [Fimbriimonadaceae bacterium]|nr:hypothetical protein [Fimbriimonadaceae bacterium]